MRRVHARLSLIAVVAAILPISAASAGTNAVGVFYGTGTMDPAQTVAGNPAQDISFTGIASVAGSPVDANGLYACGTDDTNDTIGSYTAGQGGGIFYCIATAVAGGTSVGPYTYARTGSVWVLRGNFGGGSLPGPFTAVCTAVPTSAPAIATFVVQCGFVFGTS